MFALGAKSHRFKSFSLLILPTRSMFVNDTKEAVCERHKARLLLKLRDLLVLLRAEVSVLFLIRLSLLLQEKCRSLRRARFFRRLDHLRRRFERGRGAYGECVGSWVRGGGGGRDDSTRFARFAKTLQKCKTQLFLPAATDGRTNRRTSEPSQAGGCCSTSP